MKTRYLCEASLQFNIFYTFLFHVFTSINSSYLTAEFHFQTDLKSHCIPFAQMDRQTGKVAAHECQQAEPRHSITHRERRRVTAARQQTFLTRATSALPFSLGCRVRVIVYFNFSHISSVMIDIKCYLEGNTCRDLFTPSSDLGDLFYKSLFKST